MKQRLHSRTFFLLSLFLLAVLIAPALARGGQDLTLNWQHEAGRNREDRDDYWLNYTLNLNQEVTEVISLQESVRYTRRWEEDSDSDGLHPSLRFALLNDLFALDLFYYANEQRDSVHADSSQRSGEAVWRSVWNRRFWPRLRASVGKDVLNDDENPHLTRTDKNTRSAGIDWDLELFRAYYSYQWDERINYVDQSSQKSNHHFGRLEAAHSFWENRLRAGFSHQYSKNTGESQYTVDSSGIVRIPHVLSQVLHGLDSTPLRTQTGELTSVSQLHDGDLVSVSGVFTDGLDSPPHNLALGVDFSQIDRIDLYTSENISVRAADFNFALYSSDNGSDWQLVDTTINTVYNAVERCFQLDISGGSRHLWLKVVITSSSLQRVDFSEIEVFELVSTDEKNLIQKTETTSAITDVNLSARISRHAALSYNLIVNQGEYSSGDTFLRSHQIGELKWLAEVFSASFSISDVRDNVDRLPESLNRHYNFSLGLSPLSTVNMNFGLGKTDRYTEGERQSVEQEITFYTTLQLYPDLDTTLDFIYRDTEYDNGGVRLEEYSANAVVTARLIPELTADLKTDYHYTKGALDQEDYGSDLILNWRPSNILSVMATGKRHWLDGVKSSDGVMLRTTVAPLSSVQLSLSYTYENSKEVVNKYTVYASWALGSYLTLQADGDYTKRAEESDWIAKVRLTGRFASK